ncbi:MAG: glycosyl transferase family 1 [Salinivirgaceae bacterium]|jgi:glycosyltransferase involved in cell wall biosynthesis|nr:glycosyltransferase family 4 protein [Bacteroidales bacterium]
MDLKEKKKVLIITYYWPPSGGVGVHRCLKFAKYLRDFGWEPVVYTAENAHYPYFDDTNFVHIPEGITILKQPIWEPYNMFKLASGRKPSSAMNNPVHVRDKRTWVDNLAIWIRGNFFIPDARKFWIKPSVKYLSKWLKENHIDAILSDGPPHTNTVIACRLSKTFNIPWLADYQDPWTQVDYYKLLKLTRWAHKKHVRMEQEAFNTAAKTTIASPTWKKDLESIGAKNVDVIFWGYDEQEFQAVTSNLDAKFSITHAGMLGFDRLPETFFKVLGDMKKETESFSENLSIQFPGMVDYSIVEELRKNNLLENCWLPGTISRTDAIERTFNSQVLFLPLNKAENAQGRIPGKLFECLRARRPILVLGPNNSDVKKIVEQNFSGNSFEYDDYKGIRTFVENRYNLFLNNNNSVQSANIEQYSVKNQVGKVAEYLNEISK